MAEADITLCAEALTRRYGAGTAVAGLSFSLRHGEVLGLLGPNGAGKSTTMQMLTGNLAPSSGRVEICGFDLATRPLEAKARLGYLPEHPPLYPELTVDEYLALAARLHRVRNVAGAVDAAKRRCGLADAGARPIGKLSKGYQQRVGIAQAVVHGPDAIVLDEPTAGLDPNQAREMRRLIRELGDAHSVLLSSHLLADVEQTCDRVLILSQGRSVYSGSLEELLRLRTTQASLEDVFAQLTEAA